MSVFFISGQSEFFCLPAYNVMGNIFPNIVKGGFFYGDFLQSGNFIL